MIVETSYCLSRRWVYTVLSAGGALVVEAQDQNDPEAKHIVTCEVPSFAHTKVGAAFSYCGNPYCGNVLRYRLDLGPISA